MPIGCPFGTHLAKREILLDILDQIHTNRPHAPPNSFLGIIEGLATQAARDGRQFQNNIMADITGQTDNTTHALQKRMLGALAGMAGLAGLTGMGAQALSGEGDVMSKIMGAVNPLGLTLEAKPTANGIDFIAGSKTLGLTADAGLGTNGANLTASVDKFGVKGESKLSGGLGAKGLTGGMEAKGSVDRLGLKGDAEADAQIGSDGLTKHAKLSGDAMGKSGTAELTEGLGPKGVIADANLMAVSDGKAYNLDALIENGKPSLSKSITDV